MIIDQLNLNQLRVFECVYRTGSMTEAARELHLTQPGVSQHIQGLEDVLGVKLFDRIKQRIVPTTTGTVLFQEASAALFKIEQGLARIKGGGNQLVGALSIGMPIEFGNNRVIPLLAEFGKKHPHLNFKLRLGFASTMNDLLMKGELDFAFVDEFAMDPGVEVQKVSDETLELCVSTELLKTLKGTPKASLDFLLEQLEYVEYQDREPLLRMWFNHHFRDSRKRDLAFIVRATVMDVQAIERFILEGFGAGIIPGYLFDKLVAGGAKVTRFEGSGKSVHNTLSLATLRDRTHSHAAEEAMKFLKQRLSG